MAIQDFPSIEYTTSEVRKILHQIFPERRLVLSQFTFFEQLGISKPTGEVFKRGKRCFKLTDILSVACVLSLKNEGISFKKIEKIISLIQENAALIFSLPKQCRLSGFGENLSLSIANLTICPVDEQQATSLELFLDNPNTFNLFWSYDIGQLASSIVDIAESQEKTIFKVA